MLYFGSSRSPSSGKLPRFSLFRFGSCSYGLISSSSASTSRRWFSSVQTLQRPYAFCWVFEKLSIESVLKKWGNGGDCNLLDLTRDSGSKFCDADKWSFQTLRWLQARRPTSKARDWWQKRARSVEERQHQRQRNLKAGWSGADGSTRDSRFCAWLCLAWSGSGSCPWNLI